MKDYFWKIWAILLVLSIIWLGWAKRTSPPATAQGGIPEEIRAKSFVVVDDEGLERAKLFTFPFLDTPMLKLYDAHGKPRIALGVDPDGTP